MSEPKTVQRRINFRKANRQMPRRRHDIPVDQVVYTNPELLSKFTSETGKIDFAIMYGARIGFAGWSCYRGYAAISKTDIQVARRGLDRAVR